MKKLKALSIIAIAAAIGALTSGCSVVNTEPDLVALHYSAGMFSPTKFEKCIPSSSRNVEGAGDKFFEYPNVASVRTYDASHRPGAETTPILVLSSDNNEMAVPVLVKLSLLSDDCTKLKDFHERFGLRASAFWNGSDYSEGGNSSNAPAGWVNLLRMNVGAPLEVTLDRAAQKYTWRQLWNDTEVKLKLEQAVEENLQRMVDDQMGGHYFKVMSTLVEKPEPTDPKLRETISNEVNNVAAAQAEASKADAQKDAAASQADAARSKLDTAKAEAELVRIEREAYGEDWLEMQGIKKGMTPWPSPIVAGGAQPAK